MPTNAWKRLTTVTKMQLVPTRMVHFPALVTLAILEMGHFVVVNLTSNKSVTESLTLIIPY